MPINYRDYPPDWRTVIRPRILARAGNRCEQCGVANGARIWRKRAVEGGWYYGRVWLSLDEWATVGAVHAGAFSAAELRTRPKRVKLAIAHVDHDTTNNHDANLRAWCQWCHLAHDRADNARRRRAARYQAQLTLTMSPYPLLPFFF